MKLTVLLAVLVSYTAASTGTRFPSGEYLEPVDPTTIGGEATNVEDPKQTGTLLYNAEAYHERHLTTNIVTKDFRSSSSSYFRAHPVFLSCLQKIKNRLNADGKSVSIVSGFKTAAESSTPASVQDQYARSGCGATLRLADGSPGEVRDIAEAAISQCSLLFSMEMRDIGIVIQQNSVHVHMTGQTDTRPLFQSDGYTAMNTAQFQAWCLDTIDSSIDPVRTMDCDSFPALSPDGDTIYPEGATNPESVVSSLDEKIQRNQNDFKRLIQYMGRQIDFDDSESSSTWCGSQGNPCVDCKAGYVGSAASTRCADRQMAPRLYNNIVMLQKLVTEHITGGKLHVREAWDEGHSAAPDGDSPSATSLHFEGRAAVLNVTKPGGATADDLVTLSWLSACSGMDYVQHKTDHIYVAVKKQAELIPRATQFEGAELLEVEPPSSKQETYRLVGATPEDHPLHDSANMDGLKLGEHATVGMFRSPDQNVRYLRVDPKLTKCFDDVYAQQRRDTQKNVRVVRGYMTHSEQSNLIDARAGKHSLGFAMHMNYHPAPTNSSKLLPLAVSAIDKCGPAFMDERRGMGLGFYGDGVYVDIRESFNVWKDDTFDLDPDTDPEEMEAELRNRYDLAVQNRVIDPDDLDEVCRRSVPPQRQSVHYQYQHTPTIQARRKRRAAGQNTDEQCQPQSDTKFCRETKKHRDAEVSVIWNEQLKRKFLNRVKDKENQIRSALEGCFGVCGTCLTGHIYEDKLENCDNLLHWVPWDLMNDTPNITNLYPRSNIELKRHACYAGQHCVDLSPLYSLIAPSFNKRYRPDPNKSPEEELYSLNDNPSPVYELLNRLYAMHARGEVKVWVKDEAELSVLRSALQVIFAYNKDVTHVTIHVTDESKLDAVNDGLESMIAVWTKNMCTRHSRETITPFTIDKMPPGISKRSADAWAAREEFILKEHNWEQNWLKNSYN